VVWLVLSSCREGDPPEPPVPFGGAVSVDNGLGCGIRGDRTLDCFGNVAVEPPGGEWDRVEVGGPAGCALDVDGGLACWGDEDDRVVTEAPVGGTYLDFAVSSTAGCAVDSDGALACWGPGLTTLEPLPEGRFTAVSIDQVLGCAVQDDGVLVCFGSRVDEVPGIYEGSVVEDVSVVGLTLCATTPDGPVVCDSGNPDPSPQVEDLPPDLRPRPGTLDVGWSHACVLDPAGTAVCWGAGLNEADPPEIAEVPAGPHDAISAGTFVTCWADAGELDCVGTEAEPTPP
jgi:hypothetical protein